VFVKTLINAHISSVDQHSFYFSRAYLETSERWFPLVSCAVLLAFPPKTSSKRQRRPIASLNLPSYLTLWILTNATCPSAWDGRIRIPTPPRALAETTRRRLTRQCRRQSRHPRLPRLRPARLKVEADRVAPAALGAMGASPQRTRGATPR
jgi:hypothetical protein